MMKRFYKTLCIICAILAVICIPFRPLWFGLAFFTTLCICSGVMWQLIRLRTHAGRLGTAAKWLVWLGNVVFVAWLISVAAVEGLILSGAHTDAQAAQADCVFVLGGGIKDDQPTETLRNRLAAALDVMEQNPDAHIIVCGGQGDDEICTEASVMYKWMTAHGADPGRVTQESESRNTIQNIENALKICDKNNWSTDNVAVLSSGFHLYRTRHIMENCGLEPVAIAAPSGSAQMRVLFCIREYFSIIKLVISGYW